MIKMLSLKGSFARSLYRLFRLVLFRLVSLKMLQKFAGLLFVQNKLILRRLWYSTNTKLVDMFDLFQLWFYILVFCCLVGPSKVSHSLQSLLGNCTCFVFITICNNFHSLIRKISLILCTCANTICVQANAVSFLLISGYLN